MSQAMTLETLKAKQDELRKVARELKAAEELEKWEAKTKERNPQYVVGSTRRPTEEELAVLKKPMVCEIVCSVCGERRVVGKQDAFQVRFCLEHAKEAKKAKATEKRLEKSLAGKSATDLQAEIDRLKALIAAKQAA